VNKVFFVTKVEEGNKGLFIVIPPGIAGLLRLTEGDYVLVRAQKARWYDLLDLEDDSLVLQRMSAHAQREYHRHMKMLKKTEEAMKELGYYDDVEDLIDDLHEGDENERGEKARSNHL